MRKMILIIVGVVLMIGINFVQSRIIKNEKISLEDVNLLSIANAESLSWAEWVFIFGDVGVGTTYWWFSNKWDCIDTTCKIYKDTGGDFTVSFGNKKASITVGASWNGTRYEATIDAQYSTSGSQVAHKWNCTRCSDISI